ncbi:MAG: alpha-amylase [Bacteroidales bacterium]|nr:alpha-amylase [Bacteroidales bacterium]
MKPVIYQLFPRLFGNSQPFKIQGGTIEDNGCGKFSDISSKALNQLKDMGITHVWYTGIFSHATCTDYSSIGLPATCPLITKGRAGSPYAVRDYYDVDPDLTIEPQNRMKEFRQLVQRTHKAGLKVLIDFIPNHVARQYHSLTKPNGVVDIGENDDPSVFFSPQNDFYYLPGQVFYAPEFVEPFGPDVLVDLDPCMYSEDPVRATGNDCFVARPSLTDWYDTVKLNYGVDPRSQQEFFDPMPPLWNKMRDILLHWAGLGIDGFRCDMAGMIPLPFWKYVIAEVKNRYPEILFIAEIYEPWRYKDFIYYAGFDYLYDKEGLYNILRDIMKWQHPAWKLSDHWKSLEGLDDRMLRFLENHDEIRLASSHFLGDPFKALPGMLLCVAMNRGPVMIYNGQEVGEPALGATGFSGNDGRTTKFDYACMPELQKWVNNGRFDGKHLSKDQIKLRTIYKDILSLAQQPAVATGDFYDLMWVNQHYPAPDPQKIFAWLRHTAEQKMLFLVNFDTDHTHTFRLFIPLHAFGVMQLDVNEHFQLTHFFEPSEHYLFQGYMAAYDGLELSLPPSKFKVFLLSLNVDNF